MNAATGEARATRMPSRLMPQTLPGFIWRISGRHQVVLSALSILVFLLSAAPLEVQRRIVNEAFKGGVYQPILILALTYVALALVEGIIKLGMNVYRGWVGESALRWLRRAVNRLQAGLGEDESTDEALGIETSMMLAEAEPIAGFVASSVSEPLLQGGLLVTVFGYMIYLQPFMALVAFAVFSPQIVIVPMIQRAINRRVARRIATLREVSAAMVGARAGSGGLNILQEQRIDQVFSFNMGIFKLKFSMNFVMNLLHHAGTAGVLGIGGWFVVTGETEVGTVVAFISGLAKINDPWGDLVNWFRDLSSTATRYALIADAMNTLASHEAPALAHARPTLGRSAVHSAP
jgi:ABC-type bacteriocin/lantibiotic exporter with double-glycine peptidase domain